METYFHVEQCVLCLMREKMIRPGLEPGTFCVLDRCDNQLRHRTVEKDAAWSVIKRRIRQALINFLIL